MIDRNDRAVLRDLAKRVAEIAALPVQEERRRRWVAHNSLRSREPMMLVFPEGSWRELTPEAVQECRRPETQRMERRLRAEIYAFEHFAHDAVVEAEWNVSRVTRGTGWEPEPKRIPSPVSLGAWMFDPVIRSTADLRKLKAPVIEYDEAATHAALRPVEDLFGDILNVKLRGVRGVSFHLMAQYTRLRGLEQVMVDMLENPGMLHDAMAILEEGHHGLMRQYAAQNLFSLNNDGTYHNSGGNGYTDELPGPGFDASRVRPCDMWASAEAQEMAQVSPAMHAEFVLPYEKRLLAPFGLTGYGCCEDLTRKLPDVLTIPRIRRISISPWADVATCAETLADRCIFSWKPNPAMLVGAFDEEAVRAYIREALAATRSCVFEMILKDTHTCEGRVERFDRWAQIAREEIDMTEDRRE